MWHSSANQWPGVRMTAFHATEARRPTRAMAGLGHEERFPPRRLSGRCRFLDRSRSSRAVCIYLLNVAAADTIEQRRQRAESLIYDGERRASRCLRG